MEWQTMILITVAGLLTLGIMSFLWSDNPLYKLCESIFVGVSAGYWFVFIFWQDMKPHLYDNLAQGRFVYLIAALLGFLLLMRLFPRVGWVSRFALAFVVGTTAGNIFNTYLQTNIVEQFQSSFVPLLVFERSSLGWCNAGGLNWCASANNILITVGVATGLIYFFFSKEHKGAFGSAAKVGIYFLMVTFGASFGYTVMARISLLIGRFEFLLDDWGGALMSFFR